MFRLGIISKISCLKTFQNYVLVGGTTYVTATSGIRTLVIVIDGKETIIKIAKLAYTVMIFIRRFMTIRRIVFKFIRRDLQPCTTRSLGFFMKCKNWVKGPLLI
jgi:hypothetical protein